MCGCFLRRFCRDAFALEPGDLRATLCTIHRWTNRDADRKLARVAPRRRHARDTRIVSRVRCRMRGLSVLILGFYLALICGCKQPQAITPENNQAATTASPSPSPSPTPPRPSGPIEFTDVTAEAGIRFKHNSGAFGKKYLPETIGSGCAFLDYDNDGWQDILLINSMDWPENKKRKSFLALYRNNKDGTFTDVTQQVGLGVEMYGIGVAIADYDNDGNDDVYITCVGPNRLFRNLGNGKFLDVTGRAGVGDPGFSTAAAWF